MLNSKIGTSFVVVSFIFLSIFLFSCHSEEKKDVDFLELRISRWTALEHARKTLVIRRIDDKWRATLLGDSCYYEREVQPKSGWAYVWNRLNAAGLLSIPQRHYSAGRWEDGSGYDVELFNQGKTLRYSFFLPEKIDSPEARKILAIGDIVTQEFNSPMFAGNYDRGQIGDYLIEQCKNVSNEK